MAWLSKPVLEGSPSQKGISKSNHVLGCLHLLGELDELSLLLSNSKLLGDCPIEGLYCLFPSKRYIESGRPVRVQVVDNFLDRLHLVLVVNHQQCG